MSAHSLSIPRDAAPLVGIGFVVASVASLAALDTGTKYIADAVPLVMAVWFRYAFQAVATAAVQWPRRGRALLRTRHLRLELLRGVLLTSCSVLAYLSLRLMPVGEFTAVVMLVPIAMTLLAVARLGERVSASRWLCVVGAFAGALVVVRPGGALFGWGVLLPLGLVAVSAVYQLLTSRLARFDSPATMQFYTGCVGAVLGTLALPFAWQPLASPSLWGVMLLLGVFSTAGHQLLAHAYARAPVAVLTPYLYLQIVFAMAGGWLVFRHAPDGWALAGMALIGACGTVGTWLTARETRQALPPLDPDVT